MECLTVAEEQHSEVRADQSPEATPRAIKPNKRPTRSSPSEGDRNAFVEPHGAFPFPVRCHPNVSVPPSSHVGNKMRTKTLFRPKLPLATRRLTSAACDMSSL